MYELVKDFPNDFIFEEGYPCISIYQNTHRRAPENMDDGIKFKNSLFKIEESLKNKLKKEEIDALLKPLYELLEDRTFWANTLDGLGVLANKDKCMVYVLPHPVDTITTVGDNFAIKPLLRVYQSADNYHLLGLNKDSFALFNANRYSIEEVEKDPEIFKTTKEVLGDQYTDSFLNYGSYGGANSMFHGQGSKNDEVKKDLVKYFKYVDKAVFENFSSKDKLPVILFGLAHNSGEFNKISNNPYLMKDGVEGSWEKLDLEKLKEKAWEVMLPIYEEKTKALVEEFNGAKVNFLGSSDLELIGQAAVEKRIKTILVEADVEFPGHLDKDDGTIKYEREDGVSYNDLIETIIRLVLKAQGTVVVLPKEKMPTESGIAAIFRF